MKVKELIELLKKEDPEAFVFVRGYESGVEIARSIEKIIAKKNTDKEFRDLVKSRIMGEYDVVDNWDPLGNKKPFHGIYIGREKR